MTVETVEIETEDSGPEIQNLFLDMSDEEYANRDDSPPEIIAPVEEEEELDDAGTEGASDGEVEQEEVTGEQEEVVTGEDKAPDSGKAEENEKAPDKTDPGAVDYKSFYQQITATFKADGKPMQVTSAEDAIRLMQMGANYNRKMAAMKPGMKILKTLEKNGLFDEQKLGFLIDLDKKNPEAIARLIKDAGIDPLEMDVNTEKNYKASNYTVDDRELALDNAIDSIKETDTYTQTIDVVGNKWDKASKQIVADHPDLLITLNDQMGTGIFAMITTEVDRLRTLGHLSGLSDFAAYQRVGDAIQARGGFDHLFHPKQGQQNPPPDLKPVPDAGKKTADTELKDKRRAASTTKTGAKTEPVEVNPLSMSDDDYLKRASR